MSTGFLTVTPNAAIDVTYLLERLTPGAINRVAEVLPQPGGKGNNVARVLATLGGDVVATGFAGGSTGDAIEAGLRALGVKPAFARIGGETRRCLTIVEGSTGQTTEIREPGPMLAGGDVDRLISQVEHLAQTNGTVVISGSMPPGVTPAAGADLVRAARKAGAFVALDAGGDVLREGMQAGPHLIKPNLDELAGLLGATLDPVAAVQRLLIGPVLDRDASVLLSLGPHGAVLIRKEIAYRARPPRIAAVNTVGCGDASLAGYLSARANGRSDAEAVALAVAVGTAAALQAAVGVVDVADVARIEGDVRVTTIGAEPVGSGDHLQLVSVAADRLLDSGAQG